jgi:peptidyl-prolyl cis-trans isomerase C
MPGHEIRTHGRSRAARRLLRDPLLHFLLIGAGLFALFAWRGQPEAARERIEVSADEVEALIGALTILQAGRPPSVQDVKQLVEPTIKDEVLYREALKLGLDEDDTQVRRRLIEKMTFLTRDLAGEPAPPSDAQLNAFIDAHAERFVVPARATFEQLFFSADARGGKALADARAAFEALDAGNEEAVGGDTMLFERRYTDIETSRIRELFGDDFAARLSAIEPGPWHGPIRSEYGWHLVRVLERQEAHELPPAELREKALAAYAAEKRREANEAEYRKLREHYDIVIHMPESLRRDGGADDRS